MDTSMSPFVRWLRWRGGPRLAFVGCIALLAWGLAEAHDRTVVSHPLTEALLFAPMPLRASSLFSAPLPMTKEKEFVAENTVGVNIAAPNLTTSDFTVVSNDPTIHWTVKRVRRALDKQVSTINPDGLSLMMLFDQSGSIADTDAHNDRIPAAQNLVRRLPDGARVAMAHFPNADGLLFSSTNAVGVDLPFVDDKQTVVDQIGQLPRPNGSTPLLTALTYGISELGQEADGRQRVLICLSDGLPMGDPTSLTPAEVADAAQAAKVRIYFVALGHQDWGLLKQLARSTGGEVVSAADASQLNRAFQKIAHQFSKTNQSPYEVTIEAHRIGNPFLPGETAEGVISTRGRAAHNFRVTMP